MNIRGHQCGIIFDLEKNKVNQAKEILTLMLEPPYIYK